MSDTLRAALAQLLDHYVTLANSGDAGFWDCETEPEVIAARAALAQPQPQQAAPRMKDHEKRNLVTDLCAVAVQFHAAEQLRSRIAGVLLPALEKAEAAQPQQAAPAFDADGFRAFVLRELPDDTVIGSGAWWADHLTAWARRFAAKAAPAGQAAAPATKAEQARLWCETCEGTGKVYQEHQAGCHVGGEHPCPDCDGKGYVVSRVWQAPAAEAVQPEPSRLPLTDEQAICAMWAARSEWMEAAGIDTEGINHDARHLHAMLPYFRAGQRAAIAQAEAVQPKQWPFVESPGDFTSRLSKALDEFDGLLAAVRHVLIESPPTLAVQPPAQAVRLLTADQVFADDAIMECNAHIGAPINELMRLVLAVELAHLKANEPNEAPQ